MIASRKIFTAIVITILTSLYTVNALNIPTSRFDLTNAECLISSMKTLYKEYADDTNAISTGLCSALQEEKKSLCDIRAARFRPGMSSLALSLLWHHEQLAIILIDVAKRRGCADDFFNIQDEFDEFTALHAAIEWADYEHFEQITQAILQSVKNPWILLRKQDGLGLTALHYAIKAHQTRYPLSYGTLRIVVDLLHSAGNKAWQYIYIRGNCGTTALDLLHSFEVHQENVYNLQLINSIRKELITLLTSYRPKSSL